MDDKAEAWPDWSRPRANCSYEDQQASYRQLARYVVREAALGKGLVPVDIHRRWDSLGAGGVVGEIHDLLAGRLRYQLNEWSPSQQTQRIRSAERILRDGGTCLDLALLTASVCLESYLRPLIVVATHGSAAHAFLLISEQREESVARARVSGGFFSRRLAPIELDELRGEGWLAYDPTDATEPEVDSAEAMRRARSIVTGGLHSERIQEPEDYWLIDPAKCHASGLPDDSVHIPIPEDDRVSSYLPSLTPSFTEYPSRTHVADQVFRAAERPGVTVIRGESGSGKSVLALEAARRIDGGCGWFLNASSPGALIQSLAVAELSELGRNDVAHLTRNDDRTALAELAVHRLRRSTQAWVVVVDNADGACEDRLTRWIPRPDERFRQTVLVTTTNADWDAFGTADAVSLEPLERSDVGSALPPEAWAATAGLPLLTSIAAAMSEVGLPDLTRSRRPSDTAELLVRRLLEHFEPNSEVLEFAAVAGFLPAGGFDPGARWTDASAALGEFAILQTQPDGLVRIHRAVGLALRSAIDAQTSSRACLDALASQHAVELFDESTSEELERVASFLDQTPDSIAGHHTLGRLLELRGEPLKSAGNFRMALDLIDEFPEPHRDLVHADCLHGVARPIFQGAEDSATLDVATEFTRRAQALAINHARNCDNEAARSVALRAQARSLALEGLIERKRVGFLDLPRAEAASRYDKALAMVTRADDLRRGLIGDVDDPELARSRYNFAGLYINLAKTSKTLDEAKKSIEQADSVYKEVQRKRESIYKRQVHPHIAACIWGQGVAAYYRALYGTDEALRIWDLGTALRFGTESLLLRQELDPTGVGQDVSKSRDLVYKSQLATARLSTYPIRNDSVEARIGLDKELDLAVAEVKGLARSAGLRTKVFSSFRVRKAESEHHFKVVSQFRLAYLSEASGAAPEVAPAELVARSNETVIDGLRKNKLQAWLAYRDDDPIGFLLLRVLDVPETLRDDRTVEGYISNLWVAAPERRRGAAEGLVEACIAAARLHRFRRLLLRAAPGALSLYQRHGFQTSAELMELDL